MKTLVNLNAFVWKCSFFNDIDIIFPFRNSLQQHRKTPMHFLGELDHPISLIFPLSNLFLIFFLICKCFTTWGWRKIWIIFFSLDAFPGVSLVAGALVSLSGLVTFIIPFSIYFPFSVTLYSLRPCTYFSTLKKNWSLLYSLF